MGLLCYIHGTLNMYNQNVKNQCCQLVKINQIVYFSVYIYFNKTFEKIHLAVSFLQYPLSRVTFASF